MTKGRDFARVIGIDVEVQIVFQAKHLNLLTPLFKRAGINSETVNEMIDEYISAGEPVAFERWVLEYGQSKLNPMMNAFLKRESSHPTFNNLLKVALKDEIENSPTLRKLKKVP